MIGQGIRRADRSIGDAVPLADAHAAMHGITDAIAAALPHAPTHAAWLAAQASALPDDPARPRPCHPQYRHRRRRHAGWMAAAAFSRLLNTGYTRVTLIESEEIGTVGVGEATIPPLLNFNRMLGIDENEFLAATAGTFKLGIEFRDWARSAIVHPSVRHLRSGSAGHILPPAVAARAQPSRDSGHHRLVDERAGAARGGSAGARRCALAGARAVLRLSFRCLALCALSARLCRARGVTRIEGRIADVRLRGEDGYVEALTLADGRQVAGDLFIDCSGFRGLLIEEALHTGYESYAQWLPCDRAVAVPCALPNAREPDPYTRATARAAGWQWRIPLQHRMGNGYVYCSEFCPTRRRSSIFSPASRASRWAIPAGFVTAGRRRQSWNRNVIALGLSSGFIEPRESTSIPLVQAGIQRIVAMFPDTALRPCRTRRIQPPAARSVRGYPRLHHPALCPDRRTDTPFWDRVRTMPLPTA